MNYPLPLVFAGILGAGAMLVLTPQPLPAACEPVELVRFVSSPPEIHVVKTPAFGRSPSEWLAQFAGGPEPLPELVMASEPEEPTRHHRRRRHAR